MIKLEPFYIEVTPEDSEIVQKLLFKCGYRWTSDVYNEQVVRHLDKPILVTRTFSAYEIYYNYDNTYYTQEPRKLTIEQLINEIENKIDGR